MTGRMGKVRHFFPECPKVCPDFKETHFHVFYFQGFISCILQISLEYSSLFCYTIIIESLQFQTLVLKFLGYFEWSVHRMILMLRSMIPVTIIDGLLLRSSFNDSSVKRHKSYDQPRQHIKKQRHYFTNKGLSSQCCGFSSGHVWMWELDYKESWVPKNWCFWTVVLEKTLASPLDCKEIQPVHPKGNQSWVFIGRTDAEAETPIHWPPDAKSWLTGKDPDAGKYWRQEEKVTTEDEMVGWHHQCDGHEFEYVLGDLACFSP